MMKLVTTNRLLVAVLTALVCSVTLMACKQQPEPAPIPPAFRPSAPMPAVTPTSPMPIVSGITLGNAVGADRRVTAPMTAFAPKDTIYAAVSTGTSDPAASVAGKLGVKWTHVDSDQTVHEESKDLTFAGDGVYDFQINKPDGWPTGKYKVEIALEGAVVQTREFEVK